MLEKYDADHTGSLDQDELVQLLGHYDNGMKSEWNDLHTVMVTKNIGMVTPTSEEISCLLQSATNHKKTVKDTNHIGMSGIEFVVDLWHSYVMNRSKIEAVFDKFQTKYDKPADPNHIKTCLTELNESHPPKACAPPLLCVPAAPSDSKRRARSALRLQTPRAGPRGPARHARHQRAQRQQEDPVDPRGGPLASPPARAPPRPSPQGGPISPPPRRRYTHVVEHLPASDAPPDESVRGCQCCVCA